MRDAARESAYSFHFLRLPELLLEGAALGDVFGEQLKGFSPAGVRDGAAGNANHCPQAVLAHPLDDEPVERGCRTQVIGELEPLLRVGVESSEMFAHQLFG